MTREQFTKRFHDKNIRETDPGSTPATLPDSAEALWQDHASNWTQAHQIAQGIHTPLGSRIHAYLHREEGDISNANYWYAKAGVPAPTGTLNEEWEELLAAVQEDGER
jgi:hypothetical protein